MSLEETNLNGIVREIQKKQILLPDFQRGFVWKEEERQIRIIASVLTRMPLGSILLLEAKANEYGCKMVGKKQRVDISDIKNTSVKMLLDGQQRITVLTNIFSSIIFQNVTKSSELIGGDALKRRFFIKIPCYEECKKLDKDLFGITSLCFPVNDPQSGIPDFLTSEIRDYIEAENFNFGEKDVSYHPLNKNNADIENYCISSKEYRIPLYMLIENNESENTCETSLNNILKKIVNEVADRMIDDYISLPSEMKESFIDKIMNSGYYALLEDKDSIIQIKEDIISKGNDFWKQRLFTYLRACINKMDLHQIIVKESDRERAIDIYENLNLGGVTLSTFELVLARAAKQQAEDGKNLADKIVDLIKMPKDYPDNLLPEKIENHFKTYCSDNKYSASQRMIFYKENNAEISKRYTDAFLDVLCMLCNNPYYKDEIVDIEQIKRRKILELSAEEINGNYIKACTGLDRALYFLQVRCGLRTIEELQYNLILVLLGYLFSNDVYFNNKEIHKQLEAWYWSCIFSGEYDNDQNTNMIQHLKEMLRSINNKERKTDWIAEIEKKVFNAEDFSDKSFLLLEKTKKPKDVIRNGICQYFLAETYKDLLKDKDGKEQMIQIFMSNVRDLQQHHIVPIRDLSSFSSVSREDKANILNSPINFIYLTPETNKRILTNSVNSYLQFCNENAVFKLGLSNVTEEIEIKTEEDVKKLLGKRFDAVKTEISNHISKLLQ